MAHDEQDHIDGWQTYSNWIDDHRDSSEIFTRYFDDTNFEAELKSCQNNLERFNLIWNNEELRNEINRIYSRDSDRLSARREEARSFKSDVVSKEMRDLGNQSFKRGVYHDALEHYTQAVRYAPYPDSYSPCTSPSEGACSSTQDNTLALALANRSAALYCLSRYRLCLADIDLATKFGYPEVNMFKLLIRKVKCLHILSVWSNDLEQMKDRLRMMLGKRETPEYIKTEILNMFEFLDETLPEQVDKDESDIEDETTVKISNTSRTLPLAADCVEMSYETDKGRYLLTNKDVSFGRLLVAEDPFVCNLAPQMRDKYCYHCFARLHNCGLACHDCTQIFYCSTDCLEANKQIHSYECRGLIDLQSELGVAYIVCHIMFKIGFNFNNIPVHSRKTTELKSLDEVIEISAANWPDLVYKDDYASVLSLMDHAQDYDHEELMCYTLTSAYLLTAFNDLILPLHADVLTGEHSQLVTGSVILRHMMQLQTNLISILNQNLQNLVTIGHSLGDVDEKPIGVGLYPTISLLNHNCQPNIISIFHRNKFVARASTSFECGTELCYCYGPSFNRMSKRDRQKRLKDQYFFTCNCNCCVNELENHSRAFLCPKCQGPVIYNNDLSHKCMECKEEDLLDIAKCIDDLNSLTDQLQDLRADDSIPHSRKLRQLKQLEGDLTRLAYWRNPVFVQIKSQLIECAQESDDLDSALRYSMEELDLSTRTYGENSLETIITKLKNINLDWQRLYFKSEECKDEEAKKVAISDLRALQATVCATRGRLKDLLNSTSILGAEATFDGELKFLSSIQSSISRYVASLEAPDGESKESSGGEE